MTASRNPTKECRDKLFMHHVRAIETCRITDGIGFLFSPIYDRKCREASIETLVVADECIKLAGQK